MYAPPQLKKETRMWDHGRAITNCLFLSKESLESAREDFPSYLFFSPAFVDELEVQLDWP